jgi:hypothetical protein
MIRLSMYSRASSLAISVGCTWCWTCNHKITKYCTCTVFLYLGHFLFFLCFASVQICETYPPARGKNKQVIKNKVIFACCVDVKTTKTWLFHLSTTEILNKEYKYKIIARLI